MDPNKLADTVKRYESLSFKVNKLGEMIVNHELKEWLTLEQDAVLHYIRQHQPCTSSDLSKAFYVEKSAVTAIVNRLVSKDIVRRVRSEKDRRIVYLEITQNGEKLHQEYSERINGILSNIISKFNNEEIESFMHTYEKLADLLEEHLKEQKGVD